MFRKSKDNEIDITSLNVILKTGKKLINIGYFMAILALIILGTFLLKEWKILVFIKEFLIVISPIFIGILIAWLFDPFVRKLQEKKIPRVIGCIISYLILFGVLFFICYLFISSLVGQIKDFIKAAPTIFEELTTFVTGLISRFDSNNLINIKEFKKQITEVISNYGASIVSELPKYLLSVGKSLISFGVNFVLGLMIGFYLLFDFLE